MMERSLGEAPFGAEPAAIRQTDTAISVVVPFYNEVENLPGLLGDLLTTLRSFGRSFELVFVDDGSSDEGAAWLTREAAKVSEIVLLRLSRNFGQTTAIAAGIDHAEGQVIIVMDADRQNDPADIPLLVRKLDEGFDVASGWRRERKDKFWSRRLPSVIANRLIARATGLKLHDMGCMLKAYRREFLKHSRLYGEMHRYIPVYAHMAGGRIVEVEVRHHPRIAGQSKYGISRALRVVFDLVTIQFLDRHLQHPMYFFGKTAMGIGALSVLTSLPALYWKFVTHTKSLIQTPLPVLSFILMVMAVQTFLTGLMMEVLSRTYFESQGKRAYLVRSLVRGRPWRPLP
jgi:glycosyltransferase involved in cell wall biosynthesis